MERLVNIVDVYNQLTVFTKRIIIDVWQGSEYPFTGFITFRELITFVCVWMTINESNLYTTNFALSVAVNISIAEASFSFESFSKKLRIAMIRSTGQKMKFSIKDIFSKCDQIRAVNCGFGHIYYRNS